MCSIAATAPMTGLREPLVYAAVTARPAEPLVSYYETSKASIALHKISAIRALFFTELCTRTKAISAEMNNHYLRSQFDMPLCTEIGNKNFEPTPEAEVHSLFPHIKCLRSTAICVDGKFLHANKVRDKSSCREFIASPMPSEPSLFWKFILENEYEILDLSPEENPYHPSDRASVSVFGDISVALLQTTHETQDEYTHIYEVKSLSTMKTRQVTRCHYKTWDDASHGDLKSLQYLVEKLETYLQGKTWIHCRSGVEQTGVLITAYFLKQQILQKQIIPENFGNNLVDIIASLRRQCGPEFVPTRAQFCLLLDFGISLLL